MIARRIEALIAAAPADPPMYRQVAAKYGPTRTQLARIDAWVKAGYVGLPSDKQYNPRRPSPRRGAR